jgi:membrane protein
MVKKVLVRFFSRLYSDEVFGYAAQISYYLLLSLFPFLVLLTYVLAKTQTLNLEQILQYLLDYDLAPAAAIEVMESVIEDLRIPTGMLSFYVIVVLWCASRGIRAIMNGIHMAFRTHEPRGIVVSFLRSFFYTLAFAVILISYMLLVLFGDLIFSWLIRTFHLAILGNHVFSLIRYLFPIVLMYVIYILL